MKNKKGWIVALVNIIIISFVLFEIGKYAIANYYCPSTTECFLANFINASNETTTQFNCDIIYLNLGKYYDGGAVEGSLSNIWKTACSNETIERLGINISEVKSCEYFCCWVDGSVKTWENGKCAYRNMQRMVLR
jgi:hypothetical protein